MKRQLLAFLFALVTLGLVVAAPATPQKIEGTVDYQWEPGVWYKPPQTVVYNEYRWQVLLEHVADARLHPGSSEIIWQQLEAIAPAVEQIFNPNLGTGRYGRRGVCSCCGGTGVQNDTTSPPNVLPGKLKESLQAWIYPGNPATDVALTYKNKKIDVLKPEYFTIETNGKIKQINENAKDLGSSVNGYSSSNLKDLKQYSKEIYITVSAGPEGTHNLVSDDKKSQNAINTLVNFVVKEDVTGVDIDFEGFGGWSVQDYKDYKTFLTNLGNALHEKGRKLQLCGPMWTSSFEYPPFPFWNYADFVDLPIDQMVPMTYDYHYDQGGGTPVSPLGWLKEWSIKMLALFGPDRLVIGLPSYGYTASVGQWDIKILTLSQIKAQNGYEGGVRDGNSGEVFKIVGNKVWVSNDQTSLNIKAAVVRSLGVKHLSVWHLGGGNEWFD
ncbi:glycoside hydrolase superfamily [Gaertneriomyces semiglobifer]|nr:glycoside hydrolase superfamily [Gaertneriomyces semiglobifer]